MKIEYLPSSRNDSEGLDVVRRISEFVQSAETEFVCRIKDASFIVAATYDIYHRFHSVLQEMHWALTDYSNPLLSATEGIRMFGGLTSWTGLDCWICNTNRAAWYKQAMENERQNGYSLAIVPVPVRFKHHLRPVALTTMTVTLWGTISPPTELPIRDFTTRSSIVSRMENLLRVLGKPYAWWNRRCGGKKNLPASCPMLF